MRRNLDKELLSESATDDLAANESGFQPRKHLVLGNVTNIHAPMINCLPIVKHQTYHIMPTSCNIR
jgi:hypothetical protein